MARILDAGVEGSQPYLITEFVSGPTLAEVVHREGPLPVAELRALAVGCATGIASIHQAGLVHGQFGPDMVVVGPDGPRVVDFSITPPYGAATPAADILAWAQVVDFAAAGHLPASAADLAALPDDLRPVRGRVPEPRPGGAPACPGPADRTAERGRSVRRAAGRRCPPQPDGRPRPGSGPPGYPARRQPRGGGRFRAVLWAAACLACIVAIAAAVFFITGPHPGTGAPAPVHRTPPPAARWPRRTCPSPGS